MKIDNVNILQCKFGLKIISAKYWDKSYSQNRSAEEEDYPTPDLINSRDALKIDLAEALYLSSDEMDLFNVTGFQISEGDGVTTVDIHGKLTNAHDHLTGVKSGKIPLDETQSELSLKLDTLKMELYKYLFEAKHAQGTLPGMPANAAQEQEMQEESTDSIPKSQQVDEFDSLEPPSREPISAEAGGNGQDV